MAYIFSITFSVHIIHFFIFFAISFVEGVKHAKLVDKCERLFENIMKNRTSVFNFKKYTSRFFLTK